MSELVSLGRGASLASGVARDRAPFARRVFAVTSGKGGVGKSTVSVNLAVALARRGLAVGILDADVYGPSVPRLLSVRGERLRWTDDDHMIPAENFGVKIVSVGLTTPELDTPLGWRAPVATSALVQLLEDVTWGALDALVIDLPPGTGDVQLTIARELSRASAIFVTTPQPVATDDVRRAIRLYLDMEMPIAGVVENLSPCLIPETGLRFAPFGEGGGRRLAEEYGVPFLGEIPLDPAVREASDDGRPIAAVGTPAQRAPYDFLSAQLFPEGVTE